MYWILLLSLWTEYDTSLVMSEKPEKVLNAHICDNIRSIAIDKKVQTNIDSARFSVCYAGKPSEHEYQFPFRLFIGLVWRINMPD